MDGDPLDTVVPDEIWTRDYPIHYMGVHVNARMTVIRMRNGGVLIHSPCSFDDALARAVSNIGPVAAIIAPGNFHYLFVSSCQEAFPDARTFICPGVEEKAPELRYDEMLGDEAPALWSGELSQVLVRGGRIINEVIFFHHASKTLIVTDVIENIGDETEGTNWYLRAWFKLMRMWNKPAPAPEYRFFWKDKQAARASLERVLEWDFRRIVLAHGDLVSKDAKQVARQAWHRILD